MEIRIDSQVVVIMLVGSTQCCPTGWSLCQKIRRFLQLEWEVKVCHTYREANLCVDALAKLGCSLGSTLICNESCPTQISHLLLVDVAE